MCRLLQVHGMTSRIIVCHWILGLLVLLAAVPVYAETDAALLARIEYQVKHEPRLGGVDVKVYADSGHAVLIGQVGLLHQKMLYEQIVWQTRGVIDVNSELRVVPAVQVTDQLLEEKIQKLVQEIGIFEDIDAGVKDGVVYIDGTFENATDVLLLKWRVAEISGVIRIILSSRFVAQTHSATG